MGNIFQNIKENPLAWLIQVVSIVALIIALYVTARLAPLSKDIAILRNQVFAAEETRITQEDFFTLKEKVLNIDSKTTRIEDKLDRVLGL